MKGVILAGGTGSRLHPLTKATNKHLLPVGDRLMIEWPVSMMAAAGVSEVLVVMGGDHFAPMANVLGDGAEYGLDVFYSVQQKPAGIADALGRARGFCAGGPLFVVLGDNYFPLPWVKGHLRNILADHPASQAAVFLTEHARPEAYGVAIEDEAGQIRQIVEKPQHLAGTMQQVVTGAYVYPADVFDLIGSLTPSDRGELEISELNQMLIYEGRLAAHRFSGAWCDMGESLAEYQAANQRMGKCDLLKV